MPVGVCTHTGRGGISSFHSWKTRYRMPNQPGPNCSQIVIGILMQGFVTYIHVLFIQSGARVYPRMVCSTRLSPWIFIVVLMAILPLELFGVFSCFSVAMGVRAMAPLWFSLMWKLLHSCTTVEIPPPTSVCLMHISIIAARYYRNSFCPCKIASTSKDLGMVAMHVCQRVY